jgi:signal peptidase II
VTSRPKVARGIAATIAALLVGAVHAEDRVVFQPAGQSGRVTMTGSIQDYTGRELNLLTRVGEGRKRIPAREVVEVTTNYVAAHERGRRELQSGELVAAQGSLLKALDDEERAWVRREILALLAQLALRRRDYVQAGTRTLAIIESDPTTPHYQLLPLVWTETPPAAVPIEARSWIRSDARAARLLGASWLLTSDERPLAERTLDELATDIDPAIQRLAQGQQWRSRLGRDDLSVEGLKQWERQLESWAPEWRPGGYFLIGRGYAELQEWLPAAAAWMWLPTVYPQRRDLAATALLSASVALAAAGDAPAAIGLAREVTTHYPEFPQAETARELITKWMGTP